MSEAAQARPNRPFSSATRGVLAVAALLLPSLTLVPFGGLYLWEHGLLLWWAVGALVTILLVTLIVRKLLSPATHVRPQPNVTIDSDPEKYWSDEEARAWQDVLALAARVEVDRMNSSDYFFELGQKTLNTVAQRLHPEKTDALWRFTLPEALAIVERVSRKLGSFVVESVPLGDTLTVAQVLSAYRWRGVFDVAERAYDVWRIVRIVNPATAVTNEARERLSRAVYNYGKEHVARRIAEAYVEEVGRAAIDLYGGRLMIAHKLTASSPSAAKDPLDELASSHIALNVMIGGGARNDRLAVSALLAEATDRKGISARSAPEGALTTLAEPKALAAEVSDAEAVAGELKSADVIVWLLPAGAGSDDVRALAALAAIARASGQPASPVFIPAAIYPNAEAANKDQESSAALAAELSVAADARVIAPVPIIAIDVSPASSVELLSAAISDRMVLARRAHILRVLAHTKRASNWAHSARRIFKAAGSLTRAVVRRH